MHPYDVDHRHTVARVIGTSVVVLALLTATTVMVAFGRLEILPGPGIDHRVKKLPAIGGEPLNILLMGSDARDGEGNNIDGLTGGGRRSDTTVLMHISGDRSQVYGVSLPRDALVTRPDCEGPDGATIPGGDLQMFNAAFSLGGETCTVAMMESLTGVYIDHYLSIDFAGFKEMVDAVDGVTVCIPEEVDDDEHNIHLDAGTQTLRGQDALNYVRERYQLSANSDIGRMKRQQAFMASMINKVVSAGTLTRPDRVYRFLRAVTDSITVDPSLASVKRLGKLALQFRETDLDKIRFVTVPFEAYPADPNRLLWSAEAAELWDRVKHDKPLGPLGGGEAISAGDDVPGAGSEKPKPSQNASEDASAAAQNGLCA